MPLCTLPAQFGERTGIATGLHRIGSRCITVRCTLSNATCTESTGAVTEDDRAILESCCFSAGGTMSSGVCPSTDARPGRCDLLLCGYEAERLYDASAWTDSPAQGDCSSVGGTWMP